MQNTEYSRQLQGGIASGQVAATSFSQITVAATLEVASCMSAGTSPAATSFPRNSSRITVAATLVVASCVSAGTSLAATSFPRNSSRITVAATLVVASCVSAG
ncbi:hypothetical protein KKE26_04355, partial [bacterium]|nr:hypothetical protein [bacterium]